MKKGISIIIWIYIGCLISNCSNKRGNAHAVDDSTDSSSVVADEHTSANSLDWNGTYKGITPCGDCEGIETEVTLNLDYTYAIKTKYIGKGDGTEEKGSFTWNKAGNTVTLVGLVSKPNQYFVGENRIIQLDMSGNKVTGELTDKYVLVKQ